MLVPFCPYAFGASVLPISCHTLTAQWVMSRVTWRAAIFADRPRVSDMISIFSFLSPVALKIQVTLIYWERGKGRGEFLKQNRGVFMENDGGAAREYANRHIYFYATANSDPGFWGITALRHLTLGITLLHRCSNHLCTPNLIGTTSKLDRLVWQSCT